MAKRLCKSIQAFAEARDLEVYTASSSQDHIEHAKEAIATLVIIDDTATSLSQIDFVKGACYALYGLEQSQLLDTLDSQAQSRQAIEIIPPHNAMKGPESFEVWMNGLWEALSAKGVEYRFPRFFKVESSTESPTDITVPKGFCRIPVTENELLTSEDYPRPSHMLTLDISGTDFTYNLGDHVTIMPRNSAEAVDKAGQVLGIDLDQVIVVNSVKESANSLIPTGVPVRVRDLFTYYLDIQGLAKRRFLAALSLIASDSAERAALNDLATCMNADSPYRTKLKSVFTNIDAIKEYPSIKLSLEDVLSVIPPLSPRCYSAASSPLRDPKTVQCTFVVLEYPTADKSLFRGLSTNFLRSLKHGDTVAMTIRKGFKEVEVDTPGIEYVACALGSGIALLRGIAQHFYYSAKQQHLDGSVSGRMLLYYGVRHANKDFIFKDELNEYQNAGVLKMYSSFSHDQEEFITPATKIGQTQEEVVKYLVDDPKCKFIYCGPAGPAYESVENAIKEAIRKVRPTLDADDHIKSMKTQARWEVQAFTPSQDPENPFRV